MEQGYNCDDIDICHAIEVYVRTRSSKEASDVIRREWDNNEECYGDEFQGYIIKWEKENDLHKPVERDINKRWEDGTPHHIESEKIKKFISKNFDEFDFGGDGDNGETLLYILDVYFECKDAGEDL